MIPENKTFRKYKNLSCLDPIMNTQNADPTKSPGPIESGAAAVSIRRYSKHDLAHFKFDSFLGWIRKDLIGRILIRIHPERIIMDPQQ
jgi:hypothetical protein